MNKSHRRWNMQWVYTIPKNEISISLVTLYYTHCMYFWHCISGLPHNGPLRPTLIEKDEWNCTRNAWRRRKQTWAHYAGGERPRWRPGWSTDADCSCKPREAPPPAETTGRGLGCEGPSPVRSGTPPRSLPAQPIWSNLQSRSYVQLVKV